MFIIEYLAGTDLALKTIVLEKLFNHLLLKDVLPPYLQELQKVKINQNLIYSLRSSLISYLVRAKSSKITAVKDIVCTSATSQSIGNYREVAKVLQVDRRNIRWVAEEGSF
jgi:hypothetical protein